MAEVFGTKVFLVDAKSSSTSVSPALEASDVFGGSEGVRCFTREDVRGRVTGFVGAASVLDEVLA